MTIQTKQPKLQQKLIQANGSGRSTSLRAPQSGASSGCRFRGFRRFRGGAARWGGITGDAKELKSWEFSRVHGILKEVKINVYNIYVHQKQLLQLKHNKTYACCK